jgi:hypothetical protein
MDDKLSLLREIERDYQTDEIILLRRGLCESFFGFRNLQGDNVVLTP